MHPITERPVLVTGVTGFLGSHTAIALLSHGYSVRGSLRNLAKADAIKDILAAHAPTEKLEFVQADLLDGAAWERAVEGVERVIHVASPVPAKTPKDENEIIAPAVEGTLGVLRASAAADVKRVVVTSSVAAVGFGGPGNPTRTYDESDWTDPTNPSTAGYVRSKALAERAAWDFVEKDAPHLELTTTNPVYVLGPVLSKDTSVSVRWVSKALGGELPAIPPLSLGVVDVRDVAAAHVAAMAKPEAAGKRFILNTETLWYADMIEVLRAHSTSHRKKLPRFKAPGLMLRAMALFDPEVRTVARDIGVRRHFDSTRAREILDWQPLTAAESIRDTADSLIEHGMV